MTRPYCSAFVSLSRKKKGAPSRSAWKYRGFSVPSLSLPSYFPGQDTAMLCALDGHLAFEWLQNALHALRHPPQTSNPPNLVNFSKSLFLPITPSPLSTKSLISLIPFSSPSPLLPFSHPSMAHVKGNMVLTQISHFGKYGLFDPAGLEWRRVWHRESRGVGRREEPRGPLYGRLMSPRGLCFPYRWSLVGHSEAHVVVKEPSSQLPFPAPSCRPTHTSSTPHTPSPLLLSLLLPSLPLSLSPSLPLSLSPSQEGGRGRNFSGWIVLGSDSDFVAHVRIVGQTRVDKCGCDC